MRSAADNVGRVYEFWTGRQRVAGKTTALRSRVRWLAHRKSISSVWVFDRLGEWSRPDNVKRLGIRSVRVYDRERDYVIDEELPRVVVWRLGTDPDRYGRVLAEARAIGDVAIVLDEAYEFAPTGSRWTGSIILREIVLAGAHLPRRSDGEMRPTHLIVAAQFPKSVHHLVWSQAYTVMAGRLSGKNSFDWLRDNFGEEIESRARDLDPYHWICVHGTRPDMPGYGPEG